MKNKFFDNVVRHKECAALVGMYFFTVIWWVTIAARGLRDTTENYLLGIPFMIIPFFGGVAAVIKHYRGRKLEKHMSFAVVCLALGLISWGVGSGIYMYYNLILDVAVPYPSWAELGYGSCYLWWIIGLWNLIHSLNLRNQANTLLRKMMFFIIPSGLAMLSYYLLIVIAKRGAVFVPGWNWKVFIDFAYPFADTVIVLLLAFLLFAITFKNIDRKFVLPIAFLIVGFIMNYCADFIFSYTTNNDTYYVGHWLEILFPLALTTIGIGTIELANRMSQFDHNHRAIEK